MTLNWSKDMPNTSPTLISTVKAPVVVLVKYLSAWDECWGQGIKSPSGSNVIDGIGVANPFQFSGYTTENRNEMEQ